MNTTIIKTLGNRENHMATSAENSSVSVQDQDDQLGILQRRRIEANIISPIYQIMKRELGQERASDIIREAITEDARTKLALDLQRVNQMVRTYLLSLRSKIFGRKTMLSSPM
jgi:hypothetical protein